ncbi:MAG: gliding motility lipoprotein GldD, partial [Flavobacteriaceae bacterium]|nr:gliding motility lipoprotein GldD [Flavobacteriaceae bacterium]
MRKYFLLFISILILTSCNEDVLPKPKGYLSLTYPKNSYKKLELRRPYSFEVSEFAVVKDEKKNWLKIQYPKLKASLNITYRPVQNNLKELLTES